MSQEAGRDQQRQINLKPLQQQLLLLQFSGVPSIACMHRRP
jgi:hypothetical protein